MVLVTNSERGVLQGNSAETLRCLRTLSLFDNLSDEQLDQFQTTSQLRSFSKGKLLYVQGDLASSFYGIFAGWIKLFRTLPEGDEVIVDMLTTGHLFGESAIFERNVHMCSAQVIEDVQLVTIPSTVLNQQIKCNSKLAMNMLLSMSTHHRQHYGEIALNGMLSAPQRIGFFLFRLCKDKGIGRATFQLPYHKGLIADTLEMRGATFSRALSVLQLKAGVRISGTRVEVDSIQRLERYVYGSLRAFDPFASAQ